MISIIDKESKVSKPYILLTTNKNGQTVMKIRRKILKQLHTFNHIDKNEWIDEKFLTKKKLSRSFYMQ